MKKRRKFYRILCAGFSFLAALIILLPGKAVLQNTPSEIEDFIPMYFYQREGHPKMEFVLYQLMKIYFSRGIEEAKEFAKQRGIDMQHDHVRVVAETKRPGVSEEFLTSGYRRSTRNQKIQGKRSSLQQNLVQSLGMQIEAFGGKVETSHLHLLQSVVPLYALQDLVNFSSLRYLRLPRRPFPCVISEGVEKTGADQWQPIIPYRSTEGVKICILDSGFQGYEALLGVELPSSIVAKSFRADGDLYVSDHGTACAEIVHDMAPDAELYLVNFGTDVEHHKAIEWIIDQGVDIISSSMGWLNLGAGDGTGPICEDVKNAHNSDIIWISAAGNDAERHWEGAFRDPDSDRWCNFEDLGQPEDEWFVFYVNAGTTYYVFLNWNDWGIWDGSDYSGTEGNDYDLYLYDAGGAVIASSNNDQTTGALPQEFVSDTATSSGWRFIRIYEWLAPRDCQLELFFLGGSDLEYLEPAGSLAIPADSPYAVAVGATDWSDDSYHLDSSQGPTSDGRIKPDFTAPSGVSTSTYGGFGFFGTSASASHVAGAFALLKCKLPYTLEQIKTILEARALDLGTGGKDNMYGHGRLNLSKETETHILLEQEGSKVQKLGLTSKRNEGDFISRDEFNNSVDEKSNPVYFQDFKSLGWIHFLQDFREKALQEFLKAIELEPWNAKPYLEVAKIYTERGEKRKAVFFLEKYLSLGGKEKAKELLESLKKKQTK